MPTTQADTAPGWIETRTGGAFEPLGSREFRAYDLVWALSLLCRFNGHVRRMYSVGEHSVRVHDWVATQTKDPLARLKALLHDGDEAWLGDMVRPLKYLPELAGYRKVSGEIEEAMFRAFGVMPPSGATKDLIKEGDFVLLATEKEYLVGGGIPGWSDGREWGWLPDPIKLPWWDRMGWSPLRTRMTFWSRLERLCRELGLDTDTATALAWMRTPWWAPWRAGEFEAYAPVGTPVSEE